MLIVMFADVPGPESGKPTALRSLNKILRTRKRYVGLIIGLSLCYALIVAIIRLRVCWDWHQEQRLSLNYDTGIQKILINGLFRLTKFQHSALIATGERWIALTKHHWYWIHFLGMTSSPVNYECDLKQWASTFPRSEISIRELLTKGALVTPNLVSRQESYIILSNAETLLEAVCDTPDYVMDLLWHAC